MQSNHATCSSPKKENLGWRQRQEFLLLLNLTIKFKIKLTIVTETQMFIRTLLKS